MCIRDSGRASNGKDDDFAVARYDFDGNLDYSFNSIGRVWIDFGMSDDVAYTAKKTKQGDIIIGGSSNSGATPKVAFAKIKSDGSLDTSFGDNGLKVWKFSPPGLVYDLDIIESNFQDANNNVTRFLIMSKKTSFVNVNEKDLMTTLVFQVRSIPAALYKSLGGFASNGVNITKLESYVHPQGFDVAQFYIDFEGHPENDAVKLAIDEMKFFCKHFDILGVYKMSDFRKK